MKKIIALLAALLCAPAFAQHYYFPPPGVTYNPVTGAMSFATLNLTNDASLVTVNGTTWLYDLVDPNSGFNIFWGQGAGKNAVVSTALKGFLTCAGFNACGGQGPGISNPGVNIENTAFGWSALASCTTCTFNTAVGTAALRLETTGLNNTAFGSDAMSQTVGAQNDVAIGDAALRSGAPQADVAIGTGAMTSAVITTAANDVAIGTNAMGGTVLTSATQNVVIGGQAMAAPSTAGQNVAVGYATLNASVTDSNNVAVGFRAGQSTNGGATNVFLGAFAGMPNVNGSNNVWLGGRTSAGGALGSGNIIIGEGLDLLTTSTSNETNIGGLIFYNNASLAAPAVTACGATPNGSIDARANNRSGTVTVGGTAPASCTITFAGSGYTTWNHCRVTSQTTLAAFAYSYTKTVITVTATALTGTLLDYDCDGY